MNKLTLNSNLLVITIGAFLLSGQIVHAGLGERGVIEKIQAANEPFDNLKIETAHQLPVKTVLAG